MSARPELRAPREDGAVVAEPPLADVGQWIARNRQRLNGPGPELLGLSMAELRQEARRETLARAQQYLEDTSSQPPPEPLNPDALVVAGHQPELFHPGVWVKSFALAGMARRHGVTALNLVVDNDTVKTTALRVPAPGTPAVSWPHLVTVAFDRWTGEIPYEERPILDREEFASFAERVGRILGGWHYEPLLTSFWPEALRANSARLGERFATARRALEWRWGCHNLEVTVSDLCNTRSFARFACHLLSELPRFHAIYNECVHDYRRRHGIRSRNHPVPDLARDGDWLETPFWSWGSGETRRGRLFAKPCPGCIHLKVGEETWPAVPAGDGEAAVHAPGGLTLDGRKIRSRALSNTLYCRLFLSDLFVHGIGGGKYDELTDAIIRRFYAIEPPVYLVLSATRLLPLPRYPTDADERRRLQRELRDIHWNPQRHPGAADLPQHTLVRERNEWVRRQPSDKAGRRERFRALRELTDRLRIPLSGAEQRLREELVRSLHQLDANAVLNRRDYAFVLYPEHTLRPFCEQFL